MTDLASLPARDRPSGLPVPPARMARWRDRRPLKRWRYIGLYGEEAMLCAARVRIGPLPQAFWALWDGRALRERTLLRPGGPSLDDGAPLRFAGVELRWEPDGEPIEVVSAHGGSYIWTRKQPIRAQGTIDGRAVALRGLVDDSAGYHARATAWRWCAGVGESADGVALAWNLVDGVHDAAAGSERALWVDGVPREPAAGRFAQDLSAVAFPDGSVLRFDEQARRARRDDFRLIASDYVQPFGTFSGSLPGGIEVARGWGVMEEHVVSW